MTKRYNDGADVGDILVSKWGYDQTNASWYRVERRTEKSVWLVELERGSYHETGFMQGMETPGEKIRPRSRWVDGEYTPDFSPFRRKLSFSNWDALPGAYVKLSSYEFARPWSGSAEWTSSYA